MSEKRKPSKRSGPLGYKATLKRAGTLEAKRRAALILEVLAGIRTPTEAGKEMGVSLPRYYSLEVKALSGLVKACEPCPKGRVVQPERKVERLVTEVSRLKAEAERFRSLARKQSRVLGVSPPKKKEEETVPLNGKRRKRRATVRALRVKKILEPKPEGSDAVDAVEVDVGRGSNAPPAPPKEGAAKKSADPKIKTSGFLDFARGTRT